MSPCFWCNPQLAAVQTAHTGQCRGEGGAFLFAEKLKILPLFLLQVVPVADFFHIVDLSEALGEWLGKEEDHKEAEREALESTTDRMENVLENIQGEISSCADKLKDIRGECSNVATNLEDIWRIKCELSNLVAATKAQQY